MRSRGYIIALTVALIPFATSAAPAQTVQGILSTPDIPSAGQPTQVDVTCYGPGGGGIQGPFTTSQPNNRATTHIPYTLDDVRLGRAQYVTLAANPANYGKWFNLGTVDYVSALDGKEYVLQNVVGYVHDTGAAFDASGCKTYGTCSIMMQKFDVAYGDFRGGQSLGLISQSKFCSKKLQVWTQIGGGLGSAPPALLSGQQPYLAGQQAAASHQLFYGTAGQVYSTDYYCMTSIQPVVVVPVPAGTPFPAGCYNNSGATIAYGTSPYAYGPRPPPLPPPFIAPQQALQNQIAPTLPPAQPAQPQLPIPRLDTNIQPQSMPSVQPSLLLIVQPTAVPRGQPVLVSWTSVGVGDSTPCTVTENSLQLEQGNAGSSLVRTDRSSQAQLTFLLTCTSDTRTQLQKAASVSVE